MKPVSSREQESVFNGSGAWHWNNGCTLWLILQMCAQLFVVDTADVCTIICG
jgi:hypothetical protein